MTLYMRVKRAPAASAAVGMGHRTPHIRATRAVNGPDASEQPIGVVRLVAASCNDGASRMACGAADLVR